MLTFTGFSDSVPTHLMRQHRINAAFADSLIEQEEAEAFATLFDEITYDAILPVFRGNNLAVMGYSNEVYDVQGMAKIIGGYSDDLPSASYSKTGNMTETRLLGASYHWNIMELAQAEAMGHALTDNRATAARLAVERKLQEIAFKGAPEAGLYGLIGNPNIPVGMALPSTIAPASTSWYDKPPLEILAELNAAVTEFVFRNQDKRRPTDIYLPFDKFNHIASLKLSADTDKTVLEDFEAKSPYITTGVTKPMFELSGAGAGGKDVMVVMAKNSSNFEFKIPYAPAFQAAQIDGLAWKRPIIATTAGLRVKVPTSIYMLEGI